MRLSLLFLLISSSVFSQEYPKDYFRSPMDIPLQLAGNFGEPRSNHFHAGFDIRTQQKEGLNVYASGDGYISRIKISAYGYGKAIYITHPNGFTTLYGHLKYGAPKVEKYIKAQQYKLESFEIDVFPAPGDLPVSKGELIAYSGNTGGSEGPHLHFEFRDSKTEKVINPLFFGFGDAVPDTKRPVITSVVVYPLDDNSVVNKSGVPIVLSVTPNGDGTYIAEKIQAKGRIGFGISAYDMNNTSSNRNGVYEVSSFLNGTPSFDYRFDTFHFDETRFVNALIDYPRFKKTGQRVTELFMRNKYPLTILHTDDNNGVINVNPNISGSYRIDATDFAGNKTSVSIPVEYAPDASNTPPSDEKTPYFIQVAKDYNFEKGNVSVFFPAGTFYDDFYLDFDAKGSTLYLRNKNLPVHSNYTITIKDSLPPQADRSHMFIGLLDGTRPGYNATTVKDNVFTAKVKALGTYVLAKDSVAPTIAIAKSIEGKWISGQKQLQFTIKDDLSGVKEYKGYLNGKWILFEYDYKSRRITHNLLDNIVQDGGNDLKVIVSDNAGNSSIFETHFFMSLK